MPLTTMGEIFKTPILPSIHLSLNYGYAIKIQRLTDLVLGQKCKNTFERQNGPL